MAPSTRYGDAGWTRPNGFWPGLTNVARRSYVRAHYAAATMGVRLCPLPGACRVRTGANAAERCDAVGGRAAYAVQHAGPRQHRGRRAHRIDGGPGGGQTIGRRSRRARAQRGAIRLRALRAPRCALARGGDLRVSDQYGAGRVVADLGACRPVVTGSVAVAPAERLRGYVAGDDDG